MLPEDLIGSRWWLGVCHHYRLGLRLASWPARMLLFRATSECREDDMNWTGITNLAEVVSSYRPPAFSGVALEKEMNGRWSTWNCACQS